MSEVTDVSPGNPDSSLCFLQPCINSLIHEIKTFAPWKKSYDQPRQHIKKQKHYFANKGRLVKASVFSVVMYGYESWTIKKAEHQRIDAFELWC